MDEPKEDLLTAKIIRLLRDNPDATFRGRKPLGIVGRGGCSIICTAWIVAFAVYSIQKAAHSKWINMLPSIPEKEKGSCLRRGAAAKKSKATARQSLDNIKLRRNMVMAMQIHGNYDHSGTDYAEQIGRAHV